MIVRFYISKNFFQIIIKNIKRIFTFPINMMQTFTFMYCYPMQNLSFYDHPI